MVQGREELAVTWAHATLCSCHCSEFPNLTHTPLILPVSLSFSSALAPNPDSPAVKRRPNLLLLVTAWKWRECPVYRILRRIYVRLYVCEHGYALLNLFGDRIRTCWRKTTGKWKQSEFASTLARTSHPLVYVSVVFFYKCMYNHEEFYAHIHQINRSIWGKYLKQWKFIQIK